MFTKTDLFIEINIQYFAGYPISIIRKNFYTSLLPDDADWITSEILHIYFNNKFILVNNEVSRYFIYFKIIIHILPNISPSNLKFGQVMEYNKRNIFLQKACTK